MASKITKNSIIEYAISTEDVELIVWAANKNYLKPEHLEVALEICNRKNPNDQHLLILACMNALDFIQSTNLIRQYKYSMYYINVKTSLAKNKDKKDAPAINKIIQQHINEFDYHQFKQIMSYPHLSSKLIHKIITQNHDPESLKLVLSHPKTSKKDKEFIFEKARRIPYSDNAFFQVISECQNLSQDKYIILYNAVKHHGDTYSMARLASNPSLPQFIVDELLNHNSSIVHKALCKSPLVPQSFISAKLKEYRFHAYLKKNKNLTKEQLEIIKSTEDVKDILE